MQLIWKYFRRQHGQKGQFRIICGCSGAALTLFSVSFKLILLECLSFCKLY